MKIFFAFCLTSLLVACGQAPTTTPTSESLSLTGFPEGTKWPCDEYSSSLNSNEMACMRLRYPLGSSRPDTDVLIELRGYTEQQRNIMTVAIGLFETAWNDMHANGSVNDSEFGKCVYRTPPTEQFGPSSLYPAQFQNLDSAISWSMLSLQYMFEFHQQQRIAILIDGKSLPSDRLAQAKVGQDGVNNTDGTIEINTDFVEKHTPYLWAGGLMHEWLHRKGWRHEGVYETSMVSVVDECIHTQNKSGLGLTGLFEAVRFD
ncbi:MAG: hypothetical protein EOP10_12640 [Proteobacteria bacterium]|nr:MAG: hypothetical protein EOP10_12640 [Pseudomonadota bacterium]